MAERPLEGLRHDGAVAVREAGPRGMIAVRGDLGAPTLREIVGAVTGVEFPEAGAANCNGDKGLLWMAPDEILLLVPPGEVAQALDRIEEAMADGHVMAVDVSDMRAAIVLEGGSCRDVLAKLTPADVSPAALPPGRLRRTRLGQVAAAFWFREADTAEVLCFRSVAQYAFDLLSAAADVSVGYQPASVSSAGVGDA